MCRVIFFSEQDGCVIVDCDGKKRERRHEIFFFSIMIFLIVAYEFVFLVVFVPYILRFSERNIINY